MSGWATLGLLAAIVLTALMIPHAISRQADLTGLWTYLREHHFRTWIALGGPDTWSELNTTRGFGSLHKLYVTLESIDDAELQEQVDRLRQHERFAARVLAPIFLVAVLGFVADTFT